MTRASRPVLLVGGIPGTSAEEVFRTLAPILGDLAIGFTDGEIGLRRMWIFYVLLRTWLKHPDLEVTKRVLSPPPALPPWMPAEIEGWVPLDYDDFPWCGVKAGVTKPSPVATLGYPAEAKASYETFCRLRREGVIPPGVRFQQSLPFPDDAIRLFTGTARDMAALTEVYLDVMRRDVAELCRSIPHEDLALQWDVNWETIALEYGDHLPESPPMQYRPEIDIMTRFERYLRVLNEPVPEAVKVGLHLCYGDMHHKHFKDPDNLATSVAMTNKANEVSPHAIDFVQMSIPRHRHDDAFFEPLQDLHKNPTTIYAGLIHYTDGVEGSLRRLQTFKRHYDGPTGISTECGLGRRPADQDLIRLLEIHREVAAAI
ncbi:MAG: hypothetical protein RQ899_10430 [Pseudomonadales bacterium]|nr:hypothetical protein [Pseudomonadales bacterium]